MRVTRACTVTYRAVEAQCDEHEKEDDGPNRRTPQSGKCLRVNDEHQAGVCTDDATCSQHRGYSGTNDTNGRAHTRTIARAHTHTHTRTHAHTHARTHARTHAHTHTHTHTPCFSWKHSTILLLMRERYSPVSFFI